MSVIPLDEPRGESRTPPDTDDSRRRPADRLKAILLAAFVAIERLLTGYSRTRGTQSDSSSAALPETVDEGELARYERAPDSGAAIDVELVCTETEDRLTVEEAKNPDAVIRSDTWVSVER